MTKLCEDPVYVPTAAPGTFSNHAGGLAGGLELLPLPELSNAASTRESARFQDTRQEVRADEVAAALSRSFGTRRALGSSVSEIEISGEAAVESPAAALSESEEGRPRANGDGPMEGKTVSANIITPPAGEIKYERLDAGAGRGAKWEPCDAARMRRALAGAYRDVDQAVRDIDEGIQLRTPFAFYRRAAEGTAA